MIRMCVAIDDFFHESSVESRMIHVYSFFKYNIDVS